MKKSIGSGRGSVYNIILKALQSGDKYGYEICKEVEEKTGGSYILKQPSLYSGLKRLEAQGDVKSYWRDSALGGRRHYYSLTESGKLRIEGSNFNWKDARDEIVDNLFEKSELDKTIEDVESDIDNLKSTSMFDEQKQKDIDEILQTTETLAMENKETEYFNSSSDDLFSMFNNIEQSDNSSYDEEQNVNEKFIEDETKTEQNFVAETFDEVENSEKNQIKKNGNEDVFAKHDNFNKSNDVNEKKYIINHEEYLENEKDNNQGEQLDLFYFANKVKNNDQVYNNDKENEKHFENKENDIIASQNKSFNDDLQEIENNLTTKNENYSTPLNIESKQYEIDDEIDLEDNKNDKNNQEIFKNNKFEDNEFHNNVELNFDAIYKKSQVSENNENDYILKNDEKLNELTNEKIVLMQKNNENVLDEYRKQKTTFETYTDNSMLETESNSFNNYISNFETQDNSSKIFDELDNQSQKNNVEAQGFTTETENNFDDLFSFSNNDYVNEVINDDLNKPSLNNEITNENEQEKLESSILLNEINEQSKEENVSEQNNQAENTKQELDYKDIFGDLISTQNKKTELDDELIYNKSQSENATNSIEKNFYNDEQNSDQFISDIESKQNFDIQETHQNAPELPRNDSALKDINRTLIFDNSNVSKSSDFESYDQTPFKETNSFNYSDPFEKYDTYQKIDDHKQINQHETEQSSMYSKKTNKLAFDKKYANAYNKFEVPDYEVRYFKKNIEENAISRYLSINKLNLVKSFIFSILICIATTITLILSSINTEIAGFQMFLFIVSYLIGFGTLLFNFLKYSSNKHKKIKSLNKSETMFSTFVAIVLIILSIAINFLAGMNFNNISSYSSSFVLPIFYSLLLLINYPTKKFMSKFASFYN